MGGLVWGWACLLLGFCSQIFIHHMWVRDQPLPRFCPPLTAGVDGCGFFNSMVVRLPFDLISESSEWWLFYSSVVIFMWLCKEASHVYLCCHLVLLFQLRSKLRQLRWQRGMIHWQMNISLLTCMSTLEMEKYVFIQSHLSFLYLLFSISHCK